MSNQFLLTFAHLTRVPYSKGKSGTILELPWCPSFQDCWQTCNLTLDHSSLKPAFFLYISVPPRAWEELCQEGRRNLRQLIANIWFFLTLKFSLAWKGQFTQAGWEVKVWSRSVSIRKSVFPFHLLERKKRKTPMDSPKNLQLWDWKIKVLNIEAQLYWLISIWYVSMSSI